jgi:ABC-2 type transport system ATP-binding protein
VIRPTTGRITTVGRVAALLSLDAGQDRDLSGRETLLIAAVLLGLTRSQTRARQADVVRFAGLSEERMDEPISAFSAGMRLRLHLSLLLHTDAPVLLIDEVLAVGDADFQQHCLDRMAGQVAGGVSVVIASHDMELIQQTCHRVAVLERGMLQFLGPSREAVQHHLELRRAQADGQGAPAEVRV